MISFLNGDFRFFWNETIVNLLSTPFTWDSFLNSGLGNSSLDILWFNAYLQFSLFFSKFGLDWSAISFIFFILPIFIFSFSFSFLLFKYFFPDLKKYAFLAGLIFTANTYILMVVAGGQVGVGLAYSLAPVVLMSFVKVINYNNSQNFNLKLSITAGLFLSLQVMFDPRIAYLILIASFLYFIFNHKLYSLKKLFLQIVIIFVVPIIISALLHSFWILPFIFGEKSIVTEHFSTIESFKYFSFAKLENTLSLLHPNWPENIFGKAYFMKPEFLIIPILAYSSLLFIQKKHKKIILFFVFLGLIGAFLAKGANDPFANINLFVFGNLPSMSMFRDPTKFYLLVALSYSILVPFTVAHILDQISNIKNQKFNKKIKKFIPKIFLVLTTLYLISLIYPLLSQSSVVPKKVPNEYVNLKDFLYDQKIFFRTLWIPKFQRYGYFSSNHPAVRLEELYSADKDGRFTKWINLPKTMKTLQSAGIKYVIIPADVEGEIFLDDRKYNDKEYKKYIYELDNVKFLKRIKNFGKIIIYEIDNQKDHFYLLSGNPLEYQYVSPVEYRVEIKDTNKEEVLIFSERFGNGWKAKDERINYQASSIKYQYGLNSFLLPKNENYSLKIYYEPQKWLNVGLVVSLITLVLIAGSLLILKKIKK